MLLAHVSAFDRFDEILYLVENAYDLTLPDLGRDRPSIRCDILSQFELDRHHIGHTNPDYDPAS